MWVALISEIAYATIGIEPRQSIHFLFQHLPDHQCCDVAPVPDSDGADAGRQPGQVGPANCAAAPEVRETVLISFTAAK